MSNKNIAIMYDFDKTLSPKDMQEYGFIPKLGLSPSEFWSMADKLAEDEQMDRILAYMYLMISQAKKKGLSISRESFQELGNEVELYPGVLDWFDRVNEYGKSLGFNVEHYILSSGLEEIIEGTPIYDKFKGVYASEFHYNKNKNADWPLRAINYTTKTQYLFRISKGVFNLVDDYNLNSEISEDDRFTPYKNMIYIGDGITDVPCMKIIKEKGGHAIAIYKDKDYSTISKLVKDQRINFMCHADYSKGKDVDKAIKLIFKKILINNEIEDAISEKESKIIK